VTTTSPAPHAKETDDMNHTGYTVLDITQSDVVTTVSMNHPPLNLLDSVLMPEVKRFVREVAADTSTRVIVIESAVPGFFVAHGNAGDTVVRPASSRSANTTPDSKASMRRAGAA
jgi:enoyl-CoA hydratase/carnithine racemase